jgi:hypothetical protein
MFLQYKIILEALYTCVVKSTNTKVIFPGIFPFVKMPLANGSGKNYNKI